MQQLTKTPASGLLLALLLALSALAPCQSASTSSQQQAAATGKAVGGALAAAVQALSAQPSRKQQRQQWQLQDALLLNSTSSGNSSSSSNRTGTGADGEPLVTAASGPLRDSFRDALAGSSSGSGSSNAAAASADGLYGNITLAGMMQQLIAVRDAFGLVSDVRPLVQQALAPAGASSAPPPPPKSSTTAPPSSAAAPPAPSTASSIEQQQSASASPAAAWSGECPQIKDDAWEKIETALKISLRYTVQAGSLDFGFLGDEGETAACGGQNCAYTNPSSPYGLVVLPLAPGEKPYAKSTADTTPSFVKEDMKMRSSSGSANPSSTSSSDRIGTRIAAAAAAATGRAPPSPPPPPPVTGDGSASAYQLLPSEVVLVAGCLPPNEASRYFGWTPYLYAKRDSKKQDAWVNVFASMGDTIGGYRASNDSLRGARNRLNSTLPSVVSSQDMAQASGGASSTPLTAGGVLWNSWLAALSSASDGTGSGQAASASSTSMAQSSSGSGSGNDDPYGQFAVVALTASSTSASVLRQVLSPALSEAQLPGALNVLPIAREPFTENMGLEATSPYYMLIARNIVPGGKLPNFRAYAAGSPWRVWRLTPLSDTPSRQVLPLVSDQLQQAAARADSRGSTTLASRVAAAVSGAASNGTASAAPAVDVADGFPLPAVVLRDRSGVNQSELWLLPAFNFLLDTLQKRLEGSGQSLGWSLGADSALGSLGIDWGLQCYSRDIDYCNGDNRDAQYITSLPLVPLDPQSKVVYAVGVNHRATGMASYFNVAPSDPVQRLGLQSFDDVELEGSAREWLAGSAYEGVADYLWVAKFARNCTGHGSYCKAIPYEGARSLPDGRSLLFMLRAYVNPVTGVGPDANNMVNFRTIMSTPSAEALARDINPRKDPLALRDSPCKSSLAGVAQCTTQTQLLDASSSCCSSVSAWNANTCWCTDAGQQLLNGVMPMGGRSVLVGLSRMCGQRSTLTSCLRR